MPEGGPAFDPEGILAILEEEGVAYVVIGGIAAGFYGSRRNTDDLDVVPQPGIQNARRLERALARLEADFRGIGSKEMGIDLDAATLANGANFTLTTNRGDLDVMPLTEGGLSWDQISRSAQRFDLGGGFEIPAVSKDQLIAMKRAAGRRQDIEDIVQITVGQQMAEQMRARVEIVLDLQAGTSREEALEACDIATASYEQEIDFRVAGERPRRLELSAELPRFARAHAETWAAVVASKLTASGLFEGTPRVMIDAS
ncbi:MAG: hypothetical protein H0T15_01245 [Thermoleophilaceae bacterium]|nr:hypothetical protein [Thermoleophilaceae bacterium]